MCFSVQGKARDTSANNDAKKSSGTENKAQVVKQKRETQTEEVKNTQATEPKKENGKEYPVSCFCVSVYLSALLFTSNYSIFFL